MTPLLKGWWYNQRRSSLVALLAPLFLHVMTFVQTINLVWGDVGAMLLDEEKELLQMLG